MHVTTQKGMRLSHSRGTHGALERHVHAHTIRAYSRGLAIRYSNKVARGWVFKTIKNTRSPAPLVDRDLGHFTRLI